MSAGDQWSTSRTAAMVFIARGWRVVPVAPGSKHPRMSAWGQVATTDPTQVEGLWHSDSSDGIAIVTGRASNLTVVDIDPRNGGDETFDRLTEDLGPLPATFTVTTGGGGRHLYFRYPPVPLVGKRRDLLGIDIQGEGRCVVAPPSVHKCGGRYAVAIDAPAAELPREWVTAFAHQVAGGATKARITQTIRFPRTYVETSIKKALHEIRSAAPGTSNGQTNKAAFAVGSLLASAPAGLVDREAVRASLVEAARERGVDGIEATIASGLTAGLQAPRSGLRWNQTAAAPLRAPNDPPRFCIGFEAFEAAAAKLVPWLVPGVLPAGVLSLLVGAPGVGKSFTALHLAVCLASGRPWLDLPTSACRVLCLLLEDSEAETATRRQKLCRGIGIADSELRGRLFIARRQLQLDVADDVERLIEEARAESIDLIIIDSLTRARDASSDENTTAGMAPALAGLRRLSEETNAAVLALHHTSKPTAQGGGGGVRGSSSILADGRHAISLTRANGGVVLRTIKSNFSAGALVEPISIGISSTDDSIAVTRLTGRVPGPGKAGPDRDDVAVLVGIIEKAGLIGARDLRKACQGKLGRERVDTAIKAGLTDGRLLRDGRGPLSIPGTRRGGVAPPPKGATPPRHIRKASAG